MAKVPHVRGTHRIGLRTGKIPVVAILMETSRAFGKGVIRGIGNYAKAHGPWNLHITPGDLDQRLPPAEMWHVDAVIGRISSRQILFDLRKRKVPVVCIDPVSYCGSYYVKSNQATVCKMAFEHLRDRGFRRFAFCGLNTYWGAERREHFGHHVRAAGLEFHNFEFGGHCGKTLERQLADWLSSLPKPVGLMAQDDLLAHEAINICRFVGVNVPEQIGIIGVDNDELVCELSAPTLSSVALNCERVGFEAAKVLDSVLASKKHDPVEVLVEPINVVPRQSTDAVGIDDPVVAAAMRFIREHVSEPISVADLSRQVFVSRRALEMRFEKVLGRPPHEEILRCRVARARELLISTDMKLSAISTASGFSSIRYMHRTFQRKLKQTPGEFRIANRPVAH